MATDLKTKKTLTKEPKMSKQDVDKEAILWAKFLYSAYEKSKKKII